MYDLALDSTSKVANEIEMDKEKRFDQAEKGLRGYEGEYKHRRIPLARSSGCTPAK